MSARLRGRPVGSGGNGAPAQRPYVVKQIRDTHHMLARMVASGMKPGPVAAACGYTRSYLGMISHDPAFQQLVSEYRRDVDQTWREGIDTFRSLAQSNMLTAERLLKDKLDDAEPDDLSVRELVLVSRDAADRFGYAKRSQVDLKVDFAAQLDRAISRSGVTIDAKPTFLGAPATPSAVSAASADTSQPTVHLPPPYVEYPSVDPLPEAVARMRRI